MSCGLVLSHVCAGKGAPRRGGWQDGQPKPVTLSSPTPALKSRPELSCEEPAAPVAAAQGCVLNGVVDGLLAR